MLGLLNTSHSVRNKENLIPLAIGMKRSGPSQTARPRFGADEINAEFLYLVIDLIQLIYLYHLSNIVKYTFKIKYFHSSSHED